MLVMVVLFMANGCSISNKKFKFEDALRGPVVLTGLSSTMNLKVTQRYDVEE